MSGGMSIQRKQLNRNWTELFSRGESYFVTLTFNWRGMVRPASAVAALRDLSHDLDAVRLGGRFYNYGAPDRTLFLVVPEKFDSYPHFHGLFMRPDDANARQPVTDFPAHIEHCWKRAVSGGTVNCQALRSAGALDYATKENGVMSDDAVCSFQFWSAQSFR